MVIMGTEEDLIYKGIAAGRALGLSGMELCYKCANVVVATDGRLACGNRRAFSCPPKNQCTLFRYIGPKVHIIQNKKDKQPNLNRRLIKAIEDCRRG